MLRRLFTALLLSASIFTHAEEAKKEPVPKAEAKDEQKDEKKDDKKPDEKADKKSETEHSITLGGQKIDFTATAGTLALKDAEGKTTADIFYIAYIKKG
ncbi:MAG: hypothetical protein NTV80_18300, partial [Verrucomicrobia bacterium]|nr:hypothetical protein [Verrucomicrobiota bacterium]